MARHGHKLAPPTDHPTLNFPLAAAGRTAIRAPSPRALTQGGSNAPDGRGTVGSDVRRCVKDRALGAVHVQEATRLDRPPTTRPRRIPSVCGVSERAYSRRDGRAGHHRRAPPRGIAKATGRLRRRSLPRVSDGGAWPQSRRSRRPHSGRCSASRWHRNCGHSPRSKRASATQPCHASLRRIESRRDRRSCRCHRSPRVSPSAHRNSRTSVHIDLPEPVAMPTSNFGGHTRNRNL